MYDIFLISDDVAGEKMAGPGIRAWELSKSLSRRFKVALAVPDYSSRSAESTFYKNLPFDLFFYSQANPAVIKEIGAKSRIVIVQGYILSKFPFLKDLAAYLICDLYVPFPLENLFVHKWKLTNRKDRDFIHLNDLRVFNDQVLTGDHFLCACERQKDLFVGSLLSLLRINPEILDMTPSLDDLISVVHFGITPDGGEETGERVIRGRIPAIKDDDILLFWGGVITNWYDPPTLLTAFRDALKENPKLKLFFIAKRHPNPLLPEFEAANEAVRLSTEMGLLDKHVFFNENWIEYRRKGLYFREADIGISIHMTHFETYYSFRIRLLDYLKYQLPIICTEGDFFAGLVEKEGLGITVVSQDRKDLTKAILRLTDDKAERDRIRGKLSEVKTRFLWDNTTKPLTEHCARVLGGEAKKKTRPSAEDIAFVAAVGQKPSAPRSFGKRYLGELLMKLPFNMGARIKRWLRPIK
ncbi:MAG: glycosyltransferase [Candidatus Aminicenantes bacterium]|nr:glycosyltransferase [Candidatus Aminicenantes bacterium]